MATVWQQLLQPLPSLEAAVKRLEPRWVRRQPVPAFARDGPQVLPERQGPPQISAGVGRHLSWCTLKLDRSTNEVILETPVRRGAWASCQATSTDFDLSKRITEYVHRAGSHRHRPAAATCFERPAEPPSSPTEAPNAASRLCTAQCALFSFVSLLLT